MTDTRFDVETHNPLHDSHQYGVGLKFKVEGGRATITYLVPGCSAALSNALREGDVIVSVQKKEVGGDYCQQLAQKYLNGRQGTSVELVVKGMRDLYGESMVQSVSVALIRGTASFISLLRRRDELLQSNAVHERENQRLTQRLAALSDVPTDVFDKGAQIPYDGRASNRPMMLVQQKQPPNHPTVEWDLAYLHKYVARSPALAWTNETKTQLTLRDGADFAFGIEQNDRWWGDPRVVELIFDLQTRFPGRVSLGSWGAENAFPPPPMSSEPPRPWQGPEGIQVDAGSADVSTELRREYEVVQLEERLNKIMGLLEGFLRVPLPPVESDELQAEEMEAHQRRVEALGARLEQAKQRQSALYVELAQHQRHMGGPQTPPPLPPPPTPEEAMQQRRLVQQRLDELMENGRGGVEFGLSEATLTPEGKQMLSRVAQELSTLRTPTLVEVHVHTYCSPPCTDEEQPCHLIVLARKRCDALAGALSDRRTARPGPALQFRSIPWGCREKGVGSKKAVRFVIKGDDMITV